MAEQEKHRLIVALEDFRDKKNTRALAVLRRGLNDSIEAYPYVIPYLGDKEQKYQLDTYCLVASLFALHQESSFYGNFGEHMKRAAKESVEATERRFVQLLRSNGEDLPVYLRQSISFLKSKDVSVNWNQLLRDIRNWEHTEQFVQKEWAKGFWGFRSEKDEDINDTNNQENNKK